ncbi:hypothetical protein HAP41_0000034425 [Bradyrhizobium barranii subsp. apii]|uniref:Uncharacterized protein n=1 Tax=Bradyrhizobium barranii subsp. apii TaxID=2819348 RepID=A0A8T5VF36_9BRAD|nr:hypothetical protein HAP41_0000034425 [Bradyrhizobium barranii subsp. apii]
MAAAPALLAGEIPPDARRSGYSFMGPDTRAVAQGRDLFMRREGQLNLACTNCHDDNFDKRLAGAPITQAQPTGYPLYRLEWQTLGSIERRLRSCMTGVRAQAYDYGAPELVALEL